MEARDSCGLWRVCALLCANRRGPEYRLYELVLGGRFKGKINYPFRFFSKLFH